MKRNCLHSEEEYDSRTIHEWFSYHVVYHGLVFRAPPSALAAI